MQARRISAATISCCLLTIALGIFAGASTAVPAASTSLTGSVATPDGRPISGAIVTLRGSSVTRIALSDASGDFHIVSLASGEYFISATAKGYAPLADRTVDIGEGEVSKISLVMSIAQATSLTVLGSVTVNGNQTLSTASAPVVEINAPAYAAAGVTRVSDTLLDAPSTTVVPMLGGGYNAPAVVALRGPDPGETLIDVDGHQVNNGNTGDYDLSLLDPADLQNVQVVYGIAPSSLVGPDTLGGAINIRTLEPTTTPASLLRITAGSYDTIGQTLQTTGTDDRLGYVLSFHRLTSGGELNNFVIAPGAGGDPTVVGDGLDATSTLAKLRYSIDGGAGFVGVTFRDQGVYRDLSATLTGISGYDADGNPLYDGAAGSAVLSHNAGYGLDVQVPLGPLNGSGIASTTALFRHLTSLTSQSVEGPAIGTSPYLFSGRDTIGDDTLELTHPLSDGSLSVKLALTTETLATDYSPNVVDSDGIGRRVFPADFQPFQSALLSSEPTDDASDGISRITLGQTERSIGVRYALDTTPRLHYTLATYYSDYSAFGHSLDPRFGFVWTPSASSSVRASVGSTFQSPQLPSLLVPNPLPPPVDGYVSVGNPHLNAEHSTEYDLGYEHLFELGSHEAHLGLDAYRSDLHNAIATFFPATTCNSTPSVACLSYPVNVDRGVYTGLEVEGDEHVAQNADLHATYGVDSVYTQSFPASTQDGTIVAGEQALGVPLHKATLTFEQSPSKKIDYYAGILYEGSYNELNRGPFATLRAGITGHLRGFDIGIYGTNLTNVYDDKFTVENGGVPYGGPGTVGPIPTDAYALAGRTITFAFTKRM